MIKPAFLVRTAFALAGIASVASAQTAEQIIAKARAYVGPEAALDAVRSVHFVGLMESQEPSNAPGSSAAISANPDLAAPAGMRTVKNDIDIIFEKPYRQRIMVTTPAMVQTTGLDDYDAWQKIQEKGRSDRFRVTLLQPEMIKKLRANTWENLNFYRGIEKRGGTMKIIGPATVDGVATIKTVFVHEPGISFTRYFDAATGRLVLTETDKGDRIREEGEIMAGGVRFPQRVVSVGKTIDAKGNPVETRTVITFTSITVNDTFPASDFEVPMMIPTEPEPQPSASAEVAPPTGLGALPKP